MKHRGVSEVTGSVIMLGIVGAIAALVLTLGLSSITDFQTFLIDVDITEDALKENFIVEYTSFTKDASTVILYVRNIGLNTVTIESIAIINIDTQKILLFENSVDDDFVDDNDSDGNNDNVIKPRTRNNIEVTADCTFLVSPDVCTDANYLISLVTTRGNIYEIEVIPFKS